MKKVIYFGIVFLLLSCFINSATGKDRAEERIDKILKQLTLEEKIDLLGGVDGFFTKAVKRLGIPRLKMADGPLGARNFGPATAFPGGINMAATWNVDLVKKVGEAVGNECRAKGVHILLAPGVNIYRAPMAGRNFEYYGEDPFLAGQMATAHITGVQSREVAATVKHYALNNQEWDRDNISSDVDTRTLHEIYLPPYRAAVKQGKVAAVMTAYNLINGTWCAEHPMMINRILKKEWQFKGLVMSDWGGTHSAIESANAGLDLEMPSGKFMNRKNLLPAIKAGKVKVKTIDDKVRRLLRLMVRFNFLDRPQADPTIPLFNPDSRKIALEAGRQGIVLLKNSDMLLPLNRKKISSIAVIGPNAHPAVIGGGGSSKMTAFRSVSFLDGIINQAGPGVSILYHPGIQPDFQHYFKRAKFFSSSDSGKTISGLRGEYFNGTDFKGSPLFTRIDRFINFKWPQAPVRGVDAESYSVRWQGWIEPAYSGEHHFLIQGFGGYRLFVNGKQVIDKWHEKRNWPFSFAEWVKVDLPSVKKVSIKLEYAKMRHLAEVRLGWLPPVRYEAKEALALAAKADVAVVCVGFDANTEKEGVDRPFELPLGQVELIKEVAGVNANTMVVLVAGGNVAMSGWINEIKGLLHAWFPGQEGGTAAAEIIFGDVNPSGKLPVSLEKKWSDNPVYNRYYDPDGDKRVAYKEGLFLGYRHYDKSNVKPRFPFGYGLSYTSFNYSNLSVEKIDGKYKVQVDVTNSGDMAGYDTVQCYVRDLKTSLPRPVKELKGFTKVFLKSGETKAATIHLNREAFMFFKPRAKKWILEPGRFEIMIGASSQDIRLKKTIKVR